MLPRNDEGDAPDCVVGSFMGAKCLKSLPRRRTLPRRTMTRPNVASIFGAFLVVALFLCFAQTNAQTFFDLNALAGDASNSVRSAISPICFCPQLLPHPALFSKPKVGMLDAKKISN